MSNVVSQYTLRDAEVRFVMGDGVGWSPPRCPGGESRWRFIALLALAISLGVGYPRGANAQNAAGVVKLPPLARYFPSQDLVAYVEFDGLEGHREGWQKTAAYRLLNETTTGEMYRAALPRIFAALLREHADVSSNFDGRELTELVWHLFLRGFAVGINRAGGTGPPRCFGMVIRDGAKGEIRALVERMLRADAGPRSKVQGLQKPGGRTVHQVGARGGRNVEWWFEGDDLVLCLVSPEGSPAMIDAIEGRVPSAVAHPARQALVESKDAPGFEAVGVAFFDMAALPPLPKEAVSLGLDGIKRFEYRWGFHGDAIFSIVGAQAPAPRRGMLTLFDQPRLDLRNLPPLPGGLADFTVVSLDLSALAVRLRMLLAAAVTSSGHPEPPAADDVATALRRLLGVSLEDEVLAHLGTRFTFYNVATKVNGPSHVLESVALGLFRAPKMVLVAEVKNRDALVKPLEKLVDRANDGLRAMPDLMDGLSMGAIQRLKSGETGYVMSFAGGDIPISSGLRPTLLLGKRTLALASSPAVARRAIVLAETEGRGGPPHGDPLAAVKLDWLPRDLTMLSVLDTANSVYPELVAGLPGFAESMIGNNIFMSFPPFITGSGFTIQAPIPPLPPTVGPVGGVARARQSLPPWDAELVPDPDDLRPFLFPSVHALAVDDTGIRFISREAIPTFNPSTAVPAGLAALVPAIRSAMVASDRARAINKLKEMGLAFHNFHDVNGHFPTDIRGKDGKALLSWRVAILPFLGQGELFKEFHQDEPWDSPHNKGLVARMPQVFGDPDADETEAGQTFYRGFSGAGAMFDAEAGEGVAMADIMDGTSSTILLVEARESVPWTKPGTDLPFDDGPTPNLEKLKAMPPTLGGHAEGGFHALLCDGSVRFIRSNVSVVVLRGLITRAAGEVISADSF